MCSSRGVRSIIVALLTAVAILAGATPAGAEDPPPVSNDGQGAAVADAAILWADHKIPVCWVNPSAGSAADRALVREAAEESWEAESAAAYGFADHDGAIDFTGWGTCGSAGRGIRIRIADERPRSAVGEKPGGTTMTVNFAFTYTTPDEDDPTKTVQPMRGCDPAQPGVDESDRQDCVSAITVHEFGHALGFAHEQDRADAPDGCRDDHEDDDKWVAAAAVTIYDRNSIMNYVEFCNPTWANDGNLTDLDVQALVRTYGPVSDIVGMSTHPATGDIWTWRSDGQVTVGTVDDLDAIRGNQSYSVSPGKSPADIVGMTYHGSVVPPMVMTYFDDGTFTLGSATDLDSRSPVERTYSFAPQVFVDLDALDIAASTIIDTEVIGTDQYTWYEIFGTTYVVRGSVSDLDYLDEPRLVGKRNTYPSHVILHNEPRHVDIIGVAATGTGAPVFFHDDVTHRLGTPTDDWTNEAVPHLQAVLEPPLQVSNTPQAGGTPIVTLYCAGEPVTVFPEPGTSVIEGTPGHDVIIGTSGNDVINGGAGNDTICGRGGDDMLEGGSGNDALFGGEGDDRVDGQSGHDYLYGGNGNDVLRGTSGHDILRGEAGDDKLWGFEGTDSLWGGAGNDRLEGGADDDRLYGDDGDDKLNGGDGDDLLTGKKGTDTCTSQAGRDNVKPSCEVIRT